MSTWYLRHDECVRLLTHISNIRPLVVLRYIHSTIAPSVRAIHQHRDTGNIGSCKLMKITSDSVNISRENLCRIDRIEGAKE